MRRQERILESSEELCEWDVSSVDGSVGRQAGSVSVTSTCRVKARVLRW